MEILRVSKNEDLEVFTQGYWTPLTLNELKFNSYKPRLLLANLQRDGIFIIWYCLTHGVRLTHTTVYKTVFYALYIDNIVIKCYIALGYEGQTDTTPVEVLRYLSLVSAFCKTYLGCDLYAFKINSLASLAMGLLNKYNSNLFQAYPDDIREFFERAYFGGRCELYRPGSFAQVVSFDFPAMYGTLLTGHFPQKFDWAPFYPAQREAKLPQGFIEATVSVEPVHDTPPLPYRDPKLGVIYPTGEFRGVFWWEELALLTRYGEVKKIHKVLYASDEVCSGNPSAQLLLDLRYSGCPLAKRILNSIYGRLALTPTTTKVTFNLLGGSGPGASSSSTTLTVWRNLVISESMQQQNPSVQNNKAIAAIITSRARRKLFNFVTSFQHHGKLLYLDTDEVFLQPSNMLAFLNIFPTWTAYRQVEFCCERTYKAQLLYGGEKTCGLLFHHKHSFRRVNLHGTTRPPHVK